MSAVSPGPTCHPVGPSAYASMLSPTGRSFLSTAFSISPAYSPPPVAFSGHFSPASNAVVGFSPLAALYSSPYALGNFGTGISLHPGFAPNIAGWDEFESRSHGQQPGGPLVHYNAKRQNAPRSGNRTSHGNSQVGQHNIVDMDRIRAGLDVRTTVGHSSLSCGFELTLSRSCFGIFLTKLIRAS